LSWPVFGHRPTCQYVSGQWLTASLAAGIAASLVCSSPRLRRAPGRASVRRNGPEPAAAIVVGVVLAWRISCPERLAATRADDVLVHSSPAVHDLQRCLL
jgi:hypothetical protein